ncbi:DUF4328 domain-containing protein [Microbacterium sp. NPDC090003]|uniref:DUF4328 domain-containing protein n=1 Tax=Microbacterium sp. NPDC090003 TaxID=3364203 RepID=UPI0038230301
MTIPSMNAGWYPAPDGSGQSWWWDGAQWVPPQLEAPPVPPAGPGTLRLAVVVQVLLFTSAALALATVAVEAFGIASVDDYLGGNDGATSTIATYDTLSAVVALLSLVVLVGTGILWVIWQHRLATQALGRTRRSPGWHVGSWFIPVVAWWFPYQNVSDLWRAVGRTRPGWQVAWWGLWIASSVTGGISGQMSFRAQSLEEYLVAMIASLLSSLLLFVAAFFAARLVRQLTRAYA